jgi:D-threo-aldose 1-dehydrogenase
LLSRPRPPADATYNYERATGEVLERTNRLADVCERHGVSLPAAALQFSVGHPAVVCVATGCRTGAQVRENVGLYETPLPADLWADLKAAGLLREDAPTPA